MFDDISFLVQETLKESQNPNRGRGFFSFQSKNNNIPEESCGVLYRIQKNAATFVIRIHVCDDLKETYQNIIKHPDLFPSLRFEAEDILEEELKFFICDSLEFAESIKSKLANKRFPINEEDVFNISDPGDSWWLKQDNGQLNIYFKLSHTQEMQDLIKLGPLGDPEHSLEQFGKLYGYFKMLFPLQDYSSGFGQFSLTTEEKDHPLFKQFSRLLSRGDVSADFWEYLRDIEKENSDKPYIKSLRSANYFLMELASTRRFWLEVQSQL
ncbi:MAG: hypothetical protein CME62_07370 [Halobacteriovoraceae bacterium]|nr:hypothetical protein [Halobacteriovoraceae bacterium]|tara:strand:- start:38189 stop:38992 length:804 start_codon:yes stop_codon:yes gene_type:complete